MRWSPGRGGSYFSGGKVNFSGRSGMVGSLAKTNEPASKELSRMITCQRWKIFSLTSILQLFGGRSSRFAGINRDGAVLFRKIVARDSLNISRADCLMLGPGLIDFPPVTMSVVEDKLHKNRHIRSQAAVFVSREIIFHFLQLLCWDLLTLYFVQFSVNCLLDLFGGMTLFGFGADAE